MAIEFKRAVRESVGLLIGIAGPSGSGKTYSAMRLAAGICGEKPFAVIDTEAGRAKHYADRFAFDHADLRPPFRPSAYAEAIVAADAAGYPAIVVDSFSHEHAGDGGLLDWHEEELTRMGGNAKDTFRAWAKPKADHKRMVSKLLQVRAHLILCFRAEQKIEMPKKGESEPRPKRLLSGFADWIPIAEKNLLYELTTSFVLSPERPGYPLPIKLQEQHRALFPLDQPIDENAGARIAEWAAGGAPRTQAPATPVISAEQRQSFASAIKARAETVGRPPAELAGLILGLFGIEKSNAIPVDVFDEVMFELDRYGEEGRSDG